MELILNNSTSFSPEVTINFLAADKIKGNDLTKHLPDSYLQKLEKENIVSFPTAEHVNILCVPNLTESSTTAKEENRVLGHLIYQTIVSQKAEKASFFFEDINKETVIDIVEGYSLSSYKFEEYKKEKTTALKTTQIHSSELDQNTLKEYVQLWDAVSLCKDLVNEPANKLTTDEFVKRIENLSLPNTSTKILRQKELESLKMGGILAVNQGSTQEPALACLEYNHPESNENPFVFVGKGVVYDTGGHSLKPTPNSMDIMKCDMGGAATVLSAFVALAKNNIKTNSVCLLPITDNMLSPEAFAPGDVITMHDGTTVEVKNTDAEGRLILADALSFAKKYNPQLTLDVATLTGAALRAIGHEGIVYMGNADKEHKNKLESLGHDCHERLVEFPLWPEYGKMLESDIADISNLGPGEAGAITAGKFLEHFIDYDWLHFDIAGPAFLPTQSNYRSKNASGTGVRLLYHFIKGISK